MMLSIEAINKAIDFEANYIGYKNPESVKGMLRIKKVLNNMAKMEDKK